MEKKFPSHKDHLNKTFLEEMGYKLWSTKGARFQAAHRLARIDKLSNLSLGLLNAYLIIIGLLSVYQISNEAAINENVIAFGSTSISILLLLFGQIETSREYKRQSQLHHECALKLAKLYNEHRTFKTLTECSQQEKAEFANSIANRYQEVLADYANHEDIDYKQFLLLNNQYFELKFRQIVQYQVQYYFKVLFVYHAIIISPIGVFALFLARKG